jgi:hypothetical protein
VGYIYKLHYIVSYTLGASAIKSDPKPIALNYLLLVKYLGIDLLPCAMRRLEVISVAQPAESPMSPTAEIIIRYLEVWWNRASPPRRVAVVITVAVVLLYKFHIFVYKFHIFVFHIHKTDKISPFRTCIN